MSSSYSSIEKSIASILSAFPRLKQFIKKIYARINYLFYKKPYSRKTEKKSEDFEVSGCESFFGYYDKSPQNANGHVLTHISGLDTSRQPNPGHPIQIALFEPQNYTHPKYTVTTRAYNWQQGARLQWLNDELFIFNDFDETRQRYISRIHSLHSADEVTRFDYPVQDAYKTDYFLSLNYRRLQAVRPDYGYRNLRPLNTGEIQNLTEDGIRYVDYETGDASLIISLKEIVNSEFEQIFEEATHYVNHVMISPGGSSFIFLHRYLVNGKRYDRLIHAGKDGNDMSVLAANGMVSHCCWIDENHILGYLNNKNGTPGYYIINVNTGAYESYAGGELDYLGDGHPHASGGWFVSDTYPDKSRMQNLMLNNLTSGEIKKVGEFFHGFEFHDESRCDLHPRFSPDGEKVFIDTVYSGKRQLISIAVSNSIQ